jgi:hypothetical protein
VVDLQETPAVEPVDEGGDERIGYLVAGSFFAIVGWGVAVFLNLWAHYVAGTHGLWLGPILVQRSLGPYALALLLGGIVTGTLGVLLAWIGRRAPRGQFVLPGQPYP